MSAMVALAAWWVPTDRALAHISIGVWLLCFCCLAPAIVRVFIGRSRRSDAIWCLVALLTLNRLSFLFGVSRYASHASAIVLALAVAALSTWYQRHERPRQP